MQTINFSINIPSQLNREMFTQKIYEYANELLNSLTIKQANQPAINKKTNIDYTTPLDQIDPELLELMGILPNNLPEWDLDGDTVRTDVLKEKYK